MPDQGERLAGVDGEVEIPKDEGRRTQDERLTVVVEGGSIRCGHIALGFGRWYLVISSVAEPDTLESDLPARPLQHDRVALHDFRLGIDQREHPLAGHQPKLKLAPERGD